MPEREINLAVATEGREGEGEDQRPLQGQEVALCQNVRQI